MMKRRGLFGVLGLLGLSLGAYAANRKPMTQLSAGAEYHEFSASGADFQVVVFGRSDVSCV